MHAQPTLLVTGATGTVGRSLVRRLRAGGAAVRALVRDPATADLPAGVTAVRGDLTDPATVAAAAEGADAVFLLWPALPLDAAGPVVDAITRHAPRVVYLSADSGQDAREADADAPDPISDFHAGIERLLRASGAEWTFVRGGGFAGNVLAWAPEIRATGTVTAPYPKAARSLVHEDDIADVAALALTTDGHAGRAYRVTGPDVLTTVEQVRIIGEAIGRPLRYVEQTREQARAELVRSLPADFADGILDAHAEMERTPETVSHDVEAVTGRPARTFAQWARDHAGDFR
ncbi:NmrA family NAD(P)-binding protein [Nocardiopsis trehalosi]|jgi:uncharacterized protein YbjT (DUF2867 family)|uniref:NmrA family NAD(P)-binding protein n=1 Tax=Nocardiopsis trehalosi TaxID=109329 RepID=UPI00082DDFF6|nr:NAD(P)H-binding protein [Nocardiopsis trehalosi]